MFQSPRKAEQCDGDEQPPRTSAGNSGVGVGRLSLILIVLMFAAFVAFPDATFESAFAPARSALHVVFRIGTTAAILAAVVAANALSAALIAFIPDH